MRTALKEWAVVVDALERGAQILLLRKGGLLEGRDGFQLDHPAFLLFPTWFHQQRESVIDAIQPRVDELAGAILENQVTLNLLAVVVECRRLNSGKDLIKLKGLHVWREPALQRRFDWGAQPGIHLLALRVFRLPAPATLPMSADYTGCKSWVELERDIPIVGAQPVLEGPAFISQLEALRRAAADLPACAPA